MSTTKFEYEGKIEEEFYNPACVSIEEAISSPKRSRISLKGVINDISDIKKGDTSIRRELKVADATSSITVKLWGTKAGLDIPTCGTHVTMKMMRVGEFRGEKDVSSTTLTTIQEDDIEKEFRGTLCAVTFEGEFSKVLVEDEIYHIQTDVLKKVVAKGEFTEEIEVEGRRKGFTISSMVRTAKKKSNL